MFYARGEKIKLRMTQTKLNEELMKLNHNGEIEPFRMIMDGRSNCGKTRLLIQLLKEFQRNKIFDHTIIICPTFKRNKTYQSEDFIFEDKNILVCDCDFDDVETYIKISRCYINSKPNIKNSSIIFDDIVCSEGILKRTS